MLNILLVEDDKNISKLMQAVLEQANYHPIPAFSSEEALEVLDKVTVDLIVLDVMLPRMDGFSFVKMLREHRIETPILMVTALGEMADMAQGFTQGADDYMTKPINEEEFILRINALLRRAKISTDHLIEVGETTLNYNEFSIAWEEHHITLPKKEFLLLFKLISYPNQIFTRRQLIDDIWSLESDTDERSVDVHVNRIRDRVKGNTDFELLTVRGLGYKVVVHS
ncbi:MAG: response regulator transcription factor [Defluviitaleaceae bacterium]|nr:response regulator transcription factor [Defluviitaleaceae bacterium]